MVCHYYTYGFSKEDGLVCHYYAYGFDLVLFFCLFCLQYDMFSFLCCIGPDVELGRCSHHQFQQPTEVNDLRSSLLTWYDQNKRDLPWRSLVS